MSKSHLINLNIINNTPSDFVFSDDWFDSGRLADGNNWPAIIKAGTNTQISCYEKDSSIVGCSGWVKYTSQSKDLFFCFSNPSVGFNGIAFGSDTSIWNNMTGKYENGITVPLAIN